MSNTPWWKAYSDGILRGTLANAEAIVQLVWLKLLCLHSETHNRDGWLHHAPGNPYSHEYIAVNLFVTVPVLESCLEVYRQDGRIIEAPDGDIFLVNWEMYQAVPDGKGKPKQLVGRDKELADRKRVRKLVEQYPDEAANALGRREGSNLDKNITTRGTECVCTSCGIVHTVSLEVGYLERLAIDSRNGRPEILCPTCSGKGVENNGD